MSMALGGGKVAAGRSFLASPLLALGAALLFAVAVLALPVTVPIGPMYWDVFIYYDAACRIMDGQVPSVDFFTPVGPLGYYLFAGWLKLFPNGQPALMAPWSLLAVTLPMMAFVAADVDRRSRATAFALVLPFLLFALLPFNGREFYPFPGSDAFGIYNRQTCQVLYVLVAALMFVQGGRTRASLVAAAMLALFFLKITGFVVAVPICLFALLAGRLRFAEAAVAAVAFLAVLLALQLGTGIVSAYLESVLALVRENRDTLLPRLMQATSLTFGVVAPAAALCALLLFCDRAALAKSLSRFAGRPGWDGLAGLLDADALWLGVVLVAGIAFETQNTGSQAMIFIWPPLLAILRKTPRMLPRPPLAVAALALAGLAALPVADAVAERAARAYVGALVNVPLPNANLKRLGAVSMRADVLDRARTMIGIYARHQDVLDELTAAGELPSNLLFSDFDFQAAHLITTDRAVDAIRALEARSGVRFETMMTLSFVNVFPYLMDRGAPLHIAIGADPFRAVPAPDGAEAQAVSAVDIALLPKCPGTIATARLLQIYAPMLKEHRRIALDACFDAFVSPRLAPKVVAAAK